MPMPLQVWFWRFRSPHNEIVKERSKYQSEAQAVVTKLNKQRAAIMSEAKSQLGLWSDAGIEEARASFWYTSFLLSFLDLQCLSDPIGASYRQHQGSTSSAPCLQYRHRHMLFTAVALAQRLHAFTSMHHCLGKAHM